MGTYRGFRRCTYHRFHMASLYIYLKRKLRLFRLSKAFVVKHKLDGRYRRTSIFSYSLMYLLQPIQPGVCVIMAHAILLILFYFCSMSNKTHFCDKRLRCIPTGMRTNELLVQCTCLHCGSAHLCNLRI